MKLNITSCAVKTRTPFLVPNLVAAGESSVFFRAADHAQVSNPITDRLVGGAGMVTGHRSWSPPIT